MVNVIDLESRWLHYKIKSFIPYIAIFFVILAILISFFIYTNLNKEREVDTLQHSENNSEVVALDKAAPKEEMREEVQKEEALKNITEEVIAPTQEIQDNSAHKITPDKPEEKLPQTTTIVEKTNKSVSRVLTPSMGFIKNIQNGSQGHYENPTFTTQASEKSFEPQQNFEEEEIDTDTYDTTPYQEYRDEPYVQESTQTKKINIKRQNIEEDMEGLIIRFKKNNSPALSLFIAKKYYEAQDYHNAYDYALITNNINREIESSWIIFSNSLVKLGNK